MHICFQRHLLGTFLGMPGSFSDLHPKFAQKEINVFWGSPCRLFCCGCSADPGLASFDDFIIFSTYEDQWRASKTELVTNLT